MLDNLLHDTRRLREIKSKRFPWYVAESLLFENGYQAVVLHRLAHWFKRRGVPVLGPLIGRFSHFLTGVEIGPGAEIGPGLLISHGTGLVIGGYARVGAGATLLHQVTIGSPTRRKVLEMPVVGDRVFVGAGAKIIGGVSVGSDVFIGANALVTRDIPDGSKVTSTAGIEISLDRGRGEGPADYV